MQTCLSLQQMPCGVPFAARSPPALLNADMLALASAPQLADRCFAEVQARKLAPTVRTEYFRTSFEGEAGVDGGYRVTIDESVKFVADEELLAQQRWEAPLRCQGKTRKERALLGQQQQGQRVWQLPFCILEVKIEQPEDSGCVATDADGPPGDMGSARSDERDVQPLISGSASGDAGTQATKDCAAGRVPDWVEPLLRHGALRPAVKFSKYLTGCAQLLPDSIDSIPSWMPELQYAASRALAVPGMESLAAGTDLGRGAALSHNGSSDPLAFCEPAGPDAATPAGGGKRLIDRSYRCEPKTFMANERTFLSWMRSLLPIGAVGLALLRLVRVAARARVRCRRRRHHYLLLPDPCLHAHLLLLHPNSSLTQGFFWDGLVLVVFAMTGTLYAAQRYEHRYQLCVNRVSSAELHHDRKAIPVMAAVFCLAMGVGAWVHGLQAGSLGVHAGLLGGQAKVTSHKALRGAG
jgi:hypothetical protein